MMVHADEDAPAGVEKVTPATEQGRMDTYELKFFPACHGWYQKRSNQDEDGGGSYSSFRTAILRNGKVFLESIDYVNVLNSRNSWRQNKYIKARDPFPTYDPETAPEQFAVPEKTATILRALQQSVDRTNDSPTTTEA